MANGIVVDTDGSRIQLRGWIGSQTPALCKSVGGGRWNPNAKVWTFPLDMGTCRRLRDVFGKHLTIGDALNVWAREAKVLEAAMQETAKAADANLVTLPALAPKISQALYPYQRVAARFGADAGCTFGLFDQPGLGKTLETMAAIVEATSNPTGEHFYGDLPPQMHLVFAPKVAVKSVWEPEVRRWLGNSAAVYSVTGTREQREKVLVAALTPTMAGNVQHIFVLCNIEMVRIKLAVDESDDGRNTGKVKIDVKNAEYPQLFTQTWDTVIVDESHRALIRTKGQPTQTRAGFTKLPSRRRIAISGTPMRGKPSQLWGTLNWLRPDIYTSYWNWIGRYFNLTSNGFSNFVLGEMLPGAEDRMQADMSTLVLRRTKAKVFTELPAKTYSGSLLDPNDDASPYMVWLDASPKHYAQYQEFIDNASIDFDDGEFMFANGALAEYTRRKQLATSYCKLVLGRLTPTTESAKFDWLLEKCAELGITGDRKTEEGNAKIVVASEFTSLINVFAEGLRNLGIDCFVLTGETKEADRVKMIDSFQSDQTQVRVFFLNKKAGGVAVTLDAADDLVLLEKSRNPDDDEQVEDRIHRASRIHNVTIHVLGTRNTQDEEVSWIAAAGDDVMKYLLDGTRGIEYSKKRYRESRVANTNKIDQLEGAK